MKKFIVLLMGVFLLWNCNQPSETSGSPSEEVENHDDHSPQNFGPLELNNGAKWVVNDEMKPFVEKGSDLVDAFIAENQDDYQELALQLTEQNNQLIRSCTMEGKSHDELHKWLHPHLELVQDLGDENDASKANEIVLQLRHSYQEYHQYFN